MTTVLDAGCFYSSDDGEIVMVGFADQQYDTKRFVLLQRGKRISNRERALGQGDVHVTVDDQSRSMYGGIRLARFLETKLIIKLKKGCGRRLGTDEEIMIRFSADDTQRAELLARMRELFAHRPHTFVVEVTAG